MANSAEESFREAFGRLKEGRPLRLSSDARVSQNNVAKEAGCDPTALRKSRYPSLIGDIQAWIVANHVAEPPSSVAKDPGEYRRSRQEIGQLRAQRDQLASLLVEADRKILELMQELKVLREYQGEGNVIQLRN